MKLQSFCQPIELILSDVDGVFTDGGISYDNQGIETKKFHVRDGLAVKLWQSAGYRFGIITTRSSQIVKLRAGELGVSILRQGVEQKLPAVRELLDQLGLEAEQVCYVGDDLPDLPVIQHVGLGVAVADAVEEVRSAAQLVTKSPGGTGAVRELVEFILKSQHRWDDLIAKYHSP